MDDKKSKFQIPNWGWLILSFLAAMLLWFFLSVNPQTARSFPFIPEIIKAIKTVVERGVLAEDFISSYVGKSMPVLFEQCHDDGTFEGHTSNYINVTVKSDMPLKNMIVETVIEGCEKEKAFGRV